MTWLLWLSWWGCAPPCVDDQAFFEAQVAPLIEKDCITCHVAGGSAETTNHVLVAGDNDHNAEVWRELAAIPSADSVLLLAKPSETVPHSGGRRLVPGDANWDVIREFVSRTQAPGACEDPGPLAPVCAPGLISGDRAPLRRLTDRQHQNAVRDILGVELQAGLFPTTTRTAVPSTWPEANLMSDAGVEGAMLAAEAASRTYLTGFPADHCGETEPAADCAPRLALELATLAFRRPLSTEEQATFEALMATGSDPADGLSLVIEAALQSPQFLYLDASAVDVEGHPEVQRLDDYAIAARLSMFLLQTTPGPELRAAAAAGELHTRDQIRDHVARLLDDPRILDTVAGFHEDWMKLYQLDTISKDSERYPAYGPEMRQSMRDEMRLFTTQTVWTEGPTFKTLLYSPITWTDPALDGLYGTTSARQGSGWERRELSGDQRPGFLSRAAFLTAHAYAASSSPVRRGAFVLKQLRCEELSPPPGVNLELPEPTETNTIRDRLGAHRAAEACASCHDVLDPVGFSMEHYGALGEWRDEWENGVAVDASGVLEDPPGEFDGLSGMLETLDSDSRPERCYAAHWRQWALGRGDTDVDACGRARIGARFEATDGDIRDLVLSIVSSEDFLHRIPARLEDPTPTEGSP